MQTVPADRSASRSRPSFVQERLWLATQRDGEGAAYNLCTAHRLRGALDTDAFGAAIDRVVARHDSLRMRFVRGDEGLVAEVRDDVTIRLERLEAHGVGEDSWSSLVEAIAHDPIDLSTAPLARFVLIELAPEDHILVLVLHHTIADGWSIGVLYDELADHYGAHLQGMHLVDVTPPATFLSHAERERRRFAAGEFDEAIEHWRRRLAGAPDDGLPAADPRPPVQTYRGARVRTRIEPSTTALAEKLARTDHASVFAVLLGLWSALLSRYGAGSDVVVGTPVANRPDRDARDVIGCFANTVALRCDLGGEPTLRDLVVRARERLVADQPHFAAPFERVVEALDAARSADAGVVFQHMLVLLNVPTTKLTLPGIEVDELTVESGSCQFDLSLDVKRRDGGLDLALEYAVDLYDEAMAHQILGHFVILFERFVLDPDTALADVELSAPALEAASSVDEDAHVDAVVRGRRLHELIGARGQADQDDVAVTCGDEHLTYGELDSRARALARKLTALGVGPEQCVGIDICRSVDLAVAVVAVSSAGGAFVPLDPTWPDSRRQVILEETRAVAVLTAGDRAPGTADGPDADRRDADAANRIRVAPRGVHAEAGAATRTSSIRDLAHVFYTSGSTGRPKGVAVEHRSIVNRVAWAVGAYRLTRGDAVLVNAPFTFDPFVWELFAPLMVGGRAVITPDGVAENPRELVALIRDHGVTVGEFVPTLLTRVLDVPAVAACTSLRTVLSGSEAMPPTLPQRFFAALDADLYNVYGPTETAIDSTYWRCVPGDGPARTPIGVPIANTTLHVVDETLAPVPPGVPGEICIGGVGVARGYLHRDAETRERFVPDPFSDDPGARLFRTGDLGRRRSDGVLEFIGRMDDQLSINGMRVEPGEVEHALRSHPDVDEAAVIAGHVVRSDGSSATRLVAFVRSSEFPGGDALRSHLLDRLPRVFVPAEFHGLETLPLDPNGKVDRHRLAELAQTTNRGDDEFVAPRTPREVALYGVWRTVLGIEDFGVTDDFYALGGDSILTLEVASLARDAGLDVSMREVTRWQTIEELARNADEIDPHSSTSQRTGSALAPAQEWFLDRHPVHVEHFNDAVLLELSPSCDLDRFLAAVDTVVASHRELGLCLAEDGTRRQTVGTVPARCPIVEVDLRGVPAPRRDERRAAVAAELHASLDPRTGRLLAGAVFVTDRRRHLFFTMHHLVADAVSWRILLHGISRAYEGQHSVAVGDGQYLDWIERLREHTVAGGFDDDAPIWSAQCGPALPRDHAGANLAGRSAVLRGVLDRATTATVLRHAPLHLGVPVDAVLIAALAGAVQSWSHEDEIAIAMEAHGRDVGVDGSRASEGIGWFTSLYPARIVMPTGASVSEQVRAVAQQLAALPSRGASYGWLRHHHRDAGVRARLAEVPEPELLFNYAGQFDHVNRSNTLFRQLPYAQGPLQAADEERFHLLEINSFVLGGRFHHEWTYAADIHDRSTISSLVHDVESRLGNIASCVPSGAHR